MMRSHAIISRWKFHASSMMELIHQADCQLSVQHFFFQISYFTIKRKELQLKLLKSSFDCPSELLKTNAQYFLNDIS